jgi:hypothetical protein
VTTPRFRTLPRATLVSKFLNFGNSLGSQTGYATRMSAKMRVGLVVKV